jgi:hypothetical protein
LAVKVVNLCELADEILDVAGVRDPLIRDILYGKILEFGEVRYRDGFSAGEDAERESQEMMSV